MACEPVPGRSTTAPPAPLGVRRCPLRRTVATTATWFEPGWAARLESRPQINPDQRAHGRRQASAQALGEAGNRP